MDGVSIGYIVYVIIMVVSGDIHVEFNKFMDRYFPQEDILIEEQKVLDELTRKAQQAAQLSLAVEDPEAILLNDPPVALKNPKRRVSVMERVVNNPNMRFRRASVMFMQRMVTDTDMDSGIEPAII